MPIDKDHSEKTIRAFVNHSTRLFSVSSLARQTLISESIIRPFMRRYERFGYLVKIRRGLYFGIPDMVHKVFKDKIISSMYLAELYLKLALITDTNIRRYGPFLVYGDTSNIHVLNYISLTSKTYVSNTNLDPSSYLYEPEKSAAALFKSEVIDDNKE